MEAKETVARRSKEYQQEALNRAVSSQALTNYPTIYQGFMERGIPESEIKPRENVFTFAAWRALGRTVRKGEHGVRVLTFITTTKVDRQTGQEETTRRPWASTVFHVSQTDPLEVQS